MLPKKIFPLHPLMIKGFPMPKNMTNFEAFFGKFHQVYSSFFQKSVIYWNDTARTLKEPTYWAQAFKISPAYSEDLNIFKMMSKAKSPL